MRSLLRCALPVLLMAGGTGPAIAQSAGLDGAHFFSHGDASGANACAVCHGEQGEGQPAALVPRLAGLEAGYLARQFERFADGSRNSEIMGPIAQAVPLDVARAVAVYVSGLTPPQAPSGAQPEAAQIAAGRKLAQTGDWSRGLAPCVQCHGSQGAGAGVSFPRLAGQSAAYIAAQFAAFKNGTRRGEPLALMTGVAGKLDDAEVQAVAAYFESLGPGSGTAGGTP